MRAEIVQVSPAYKAVFAFAAGAVDEQAWLNSIGKTCSGRSCTVPAGKLIEFGVLNRERQQAIGCDLGQPGYWLGVQVTDNEIWRQVASGSIGSFELDLGTDGLVLDFEGQKTKQGVRKMIDEQTAIEKGQCCGLVRKCLRAVANGDLDSVSKADFEKSLDNMAKARAEEDMTDYHAAYAAMLETPVGRALYSGYVGVVPAPVRKAAGGGEAWREIQEQARQLQEVDGTVTLEEAVEKVLSADPQLYSAYLQESA